MTHQTLPDPERRLDALEDERSTDPGRFGARASAGDPGHRAGAGARVGSALALLALVAGVPALLWYLAGSGPFPTSLPTKETLTSQLSFETLLNILVFVVWVAWLFFVVCVVVEIVAARRGGLAQPVPLGGPLQKLARALVGALLLAEVLSGPAASAVAPEHQGAEVTSSAVVQAEAQVAVEQAPAPQAERRAAHEITEQAHLVGHKVYTVAAPKDGYHDNLWDIAERHLGDGRRYQEIYQLNKGLNQEDGRKLQLARLIQPGWNLVMPEDAVGVKRIEAPPPPATPAPAPTNVGTGTGVQADQSIEAQGVQESPGGLLGTGLLAAVALGALAMERRRRIGAASAAADVEAELRGAATPSRAAFLDRALRDLAVACRDASLPLPPVYAVTVDDQTVTLRLAPRSPEPAGEWRTDDEGATWTREVFEPVEGLADQPSPYPALVSLGVDETGRDVLVDLEAAGGLVAVDGDPGVVSEVAAAIALQSGTASWAGQMRVTATGLPAGLAGVGDDRIRIVEGLDAEIDELEHGLEAIRADVLTGRLGRHATDPSRLVVVGSEVDAATQERLVGLTGPDRQALAVVLAGGHRAARWTLRVDSTGHLRVEELGISVIANRIGARQVEGIAALFDAARQTDGPDSGGLVDIPAPRHQVDDASWSTAPRRIGVLGAIAVTGVGPDDVRLHQMTELVVYLAMNPQGVHPNVLAGVLFPKGVTPDVSEAVVERTRAWLGDDVHGHAYLREDAEGRLLLSDAVVCDWDAVRSLFLRARTATSRREEVELLRRGLQLVRGHAFTGAPDGRYGWVAHLDLERTIRRVVVASAHRLADLLGGDDDPSGAAVAAEAGLRVDEANQLLWRDVLRARYAADGVAGVRRTLDAMQAPLRGIRLEPETEALVQEYLPSESATG